ncbi:MAG: mechanosensitive ion channel [Acidobacteria bacterium]|nr:mechanosensitive ion channel [Acidobacteriota bacterium]
MFRLSLRLVVLTALLVHTAAIVRPAGAGQPPTDTAVEAESAQPAPDVAEPQPVLEGEIPVQADLVLADLRRVETLLEQTDEIDEIEVAWDAKAEAIVALHGELDGIDADTVSNRRLEDHRIRWVETSDDLAPWAAILQARLALLQSEREDLRDHRLRWELTRERAAADDLTPELLGRIDVLLARVVDIELRVLEQRNAVGAVIERVAAGREVVAESVARVDATALRVRDRLRRRDAPPLWRAFGSDVSASVDVTRSIDYWWRTLSAYVTESRGALALLSAAFGLVLVCALVLQRRSRIRVDDDTHAQASRVVARPASLAVALTLCLAAVVLRNPVGAVGDVVFVLMTVPVLRLGSALLPPAGVRALYAVTGLAMLHRVSTLAADGSLVQRLFVLALAGLSLIAVVLAMRRAFRADGTVAGWRLVAVTGALATAVALGLSLGAGILGWATLSTTLVRATILSAYAGVVWVVAVAATLVLVPVLTSGGLSRVLRSVRRDSEAYRRGLAVVVTVVAAVAWVRRVLVEFRLDEPLRRGVEAFTAMSLSLGDLTVSTGNILGALLILAASVPVARFARFSIGEEVLPRFRVPFGAGNSIVAIAGYVVYVAAGLTAASALGLSGGQLTVAFGALGVGIGFGLQGIISNFVSGLILMFERPIRVGDTIQQEGQLATVLRIGLRASTVRTMDGAEVLIPNESLVTKELTNWSFSDHARRVWISIGVAYGTDPRQVLDILTSVALESSLVLKDPPPQAVMMGHGDSALEFKLLVWARVDDYLTVINGMNVGINEALREARIKIPFPQRDLHVKTVSSEAPSTSDGREGDVTHALAGGKANPQEHS